MPFNLSQLKNHKVFKGKYTDSREFDGWFIGSFLPADHPAQTQQIEVMYKEHQKGWRQVKHYHQHKVEIFLILAGKARYWVNDQEYLLEAGDFMFIDVNNVVEGELLEDCKILAIHSPSIVKDKVVVE